MNTNNKNRLGIFHIFDKEGMIDEYIIYMLEGISAHLKDLYIVYNGDVNQSGMEKLMTITQNVIIHENVGFDAGGYQYALTNWIGWEKVRKYDELLLFNDSFFGPIDTFDIVFERMEEKKVDFWTLTNTKGNEYSSAHIQSYFIAIKRKLLHSVDFVNYWENLPVITSFKDAVTIYEENFAEYFECRGYILGVFINNEEYFWGKEQYNLSPYHDLQYELMSFQDYPVLKKKLFALELNSDSFGIERQGREQFTQVLEYIKMRKNYKMKLIWENILRCYPLRNIQENCCLRVILPNVKNERIYSEEKIVVFLVLKDRHSNYENLKRLRNKNFHIILISDSDRMLKKIDCKEFLSKEVHLKFSTKDVINVIHERITDLEKQYKYCCFISDFYWEKGEIPYTIGASKLWEDWENIIGRDNYIDYVIRLFEENQECGLLVTPRPIHAHYFGERGELVRLDQIKCKKFVNKSELKEYICRSKKKAWWSNSFWTRVSLLKEVLDVIDDIKEDIFSWEYFDSLCEILPYWYQKHGYYTEVICSDIVARNRCTIQESCMETMIGQFKRIIDFQNYRELQIMLELYFRNIDNIQNFMKNHKRVYIYGAGEKAKTLSHLHCMDNINCFIISDDQKKSNELNGRIVKYLSDIRFDMNDGIILGLNEKNTRQVTETFKIMGIKNDVLRIEDGGMFDGGWLDFSI